MKIPEHINARGPSGAIHEIKAQKIITYKGIDNMIIITKCGLHLPELRVKKTTRKANCRKCIA